jgi:hypothetical protein
VIDETPGLKQHNRAVEGKQMVAADDERRRSDQEEIDEVLKERAAQGRRRVHGIVVVMNDVHRPHEAGRMLQAVRPVLEEIPHEREHQRGRQQRADAFGMPAREDRAHKPVDAQRFGEPCHQLVESRY